MKTEFLATIGKIGRKSSLFEAFFELIMDKYANNAIWKESFIQEGFPVLQSVIQDNV